MLTRRGLVCLIGAIVISVAGCGRQKAQFVATDVTGSAIGGDFTLTAHDGKPRSLGDFQGKVVVLFFGYTHCPDICPTTMSEAASALKSLGKTADQVQVLFVTVDPERDTQAILAQYVPAFNPTFIGLRGTIAETQTVAAKYKIFFQKNGTDPSNYSVDHSAGSYILDKSGKLRLFVNYGAGAKVFAHDLALLIDES